MIPAQFDYLAPTSVEDTFGGFGIDIVNVTVGEVPPVFTVVPPPFIGQTCGVENIGQALGIKLSGNTCEATEGLVRFKAAYVSAKHGVLGLVKTLALEGADAGLLATEGDGHCSTSGGAGGHVALLYVLAPGWRLNWNQSWFHHAVMHTP